MRSSIFNTMFTAALTAITSLTTPHLATAEPVADVTVQDLKVKTYEILGKDTATVTFAPGSSDLSESEKNNLAAVVTAVRNTATISSAIVAGWSDLDYPQTKGLKLGKAERALAEARIKKVTSALSDLGVKSVKTHSMAEHPSWLGKLLNTEDTKLKGEGKITDANDHLTEAIGKVIRENGGPSKVVVIVRRQGDVTAH
jgi:hypothetical protein